MILARIVQVFFLIECNARHSKYLKHFYLLFLGREVLDEAAAAVEVGVTTDELDRIVHEASVDRECYPSPLNYYQFPKR